MGAPEVVLVRLRYYYSFSNSLIIHLVNTKEIRTMMVVWKSDLNVHRFLRFYFSVFSIVLVLLRRYIKHSRHESVSSHVQTP